MTSLINVAICAEPFLDVISVTNALLNMRKTHLRKLYLTYNGWSRLPDGMFNSLNESKIEKIDLTGNNLQIVNFSGFVHLRTLTRLRVEFNNVMTVLPRNMTSLRHLLLGHNKIFKLPQWCNHYKNDSLLPNLIELRLESNLIQNLGPFRCLPRLKTLILENNLIGAIYRNTFRELKVLTKLLLDTDRNSLKKIEEGAFNITSLKTLSIRGARFHFDRLTTSALGRLFYYCSNLENLDLGENYIGSKALVEMLTGMPKLRKLNLETTKIVNLPVHVFSKYRLLETLILSRNRVYGWNSGVEVFGIDTNLKFLDLSNNFIKLVNETLLSQSLLVSLRTLNLAINQFFCTCDQMWFVNWLRSTNISIIGYPKLYKCVQPKELHGMLLKDYMPTVASCTPWNPIFTVVISMSAFGVIVIVAIVVVVKCQMNLKNYIYLLRVHRRRKQGYIPLSNGDDFEYHAFVVYCDANRMWVHNDFVKKLENEEGFKFCIHQRDFEAGNTISANIDNFLQKSWKIVVVMSNDFAKSEWCQWEVDIVQERRRRQGRDAFVLIMLENITSKNMTSPLRTLLDSTPYLRYKKGIGEDLFWKAVTESLRKSIGQPPVSVL